MRQLIFILFFFNVNTAQAMSPPRQGAATGTIDLSWRHVMTHQNRDYADSMKLGYNVGPFHLAAEQSLPRDQDEQAFFGGLFGMRVGPMQGLPLFEKFRPVIGLDMFGFRARGDGIMPYTGIELGLSRRVSKHWGLFISVSAEYPGIFMVPGDVFKREGDPGPGERDGLLTYLNIGVSFDRHGPVTVDYYKQRGLDPQRFN